MGKAQPFGDDGSNYQVGAIPDGTLPAAVFALHTAKDHIEGRYRRRPTEVRSTLKFNKHLIIEPPIGDLERPSIQGESEA